MAKKNCSVWNKELTVKEQVDKAITNLLYAEADLEALLNAKIAPDKHEQVKALKEHPDYLKAKAERLKRALKEFGVEDAAAQVADADTKLSFL